MKPRLTPYGSVRRRRRARGSSPMHEINVTPFVDVMLVLLIVFMVTAPLLSVGVEVSLPESEATALTESIEPLVVTVQQDGRIYISEDALDMDSLTPRLRAITRNNPDQTIYVRGDRGLAYGEVMRVIGHINAAGFRRVTLVTQIPREG